MLAIKEFWNGESNQRPIENRVTSIALALSICAIITVTTLFFTHPEFTTFSHSYPPELFWSLYSVAGVGVIGIPTAILLRLLCLESKPLNPKTKPVSTCWLEATKKESLSGTITLEVSESSIRKILQENPQLEYLTIYLPHGWPPSTFIYLDRDQFLIKGELLTYLEYSGYTHNSFSFSRTQVPYKSGLFF